MTLVRQCARCGNTHEVEFLPLERAIKNDSTFWTHWAPCPTNGDPILMRVTGA